MDESERRARIICQATTSMDPETRVSRYTPIPIGRGLVAVPPLDDTVPLWTLYVPAAEKMIEDEQRRREHA